MVTLDEVKLYLRVDGSEDDGLIQGLMDTAAQIVQDVSRLDDNEFDPDDSTVRIAILYTIAYLYEHRENATHKGLTLTLRALLFGQREAKF